MSANPYKRGTTERVHCAPSRRELDAEELNGVLTELWSMAADSTDEDADSLWRASARIRWGARVACARMRVQVAEARCDKDRVLSGCGWVLPELRAERDRARRVLAKLEGREP